jgi:ubiquinone/menaquinone biosynthesis C-methylase UbiE
LSGDRPGVPADSTAADGGYVPGYFQTRLAPNARRTKVWQHICAYLQRWISPDSDVLELGAGWCDFSNSVLARRVVAMDLDAAVSRAAAGQVTPVVGDSTDLRQFEDGSFDVVFASNLLEHLERTAASRLLSEARRVLRPGGRLLLLQPNFRLNPGRYFDDFTHVAIYTDVSIRDYLTAEGWTVTNVKARFLPLTLQSRAAGLTFLVPWYLRSPVRPLAGQMLVVAAR